MRKLTDVMLDVGEDLGKSTIRGEVRGKNSGVAELRDDGSRHRNILKLEVVN